MKPKQVVVTSLALVTAVGVFRFAKLMNDVVRWLDESATRTEVQP